MDNDVNEELKKILDREKEKNEAWDKLIKSISIIDGVVFNLEGDSFTQNKPELWNEYGVHIYKAMNDLRESLHKI